MILERKPCKKCGKIEDMAPSCNECLSCRIKDYNNRNISPYRKYYLKNRAQILEKAKKRREENIKLQKENGAPKLTISKERRKERAKWTVEFIKTDDGYSWRAWFRNPVTDRLVKFESARVFLDILAAQQDYTKATR